MQQYQFIYMMHFPSPLLQSSSQGDYLYYLQSLIDDQLKKICCASLLDKNALTNVGVYTPRIKTNPTQIKQN